MRFPRVPGPRSLAAQLFTMQAVLIAVVVAGCALFTYLSDRSQAEDAAGRQAMAVARSVADSPSVREAIRTAPEPTTCSSRTRPGAARHGRRLHHDHEPRGHPLDPPRQGPDRGALPRAHGTRAARRDLHGGLHRHARPVRPRRSPRSRDGPTARSSALVSAGITVEEISAQVARPGDGAARRRGRRAGARRGRHVRHQRPAAPPHPRDERGRAQPDARLPPGRAARRTRGAADARRAAQGRADQRRRAGAARALRRRGRPVRGRAGAARAADRARCWPPSRGSTRCI